MKKKIFAIISVTAVGLLIATSAFAELSTTFDAPPTMTSDVAATPAGVYEAAALTNLNAATVDFKLMANTNALIPSERGTQAATDGYNACVQELVRIPKYITASTTAANQAIAQASADIKAASAQGATPAQIATSKLESVVATDAETTITDANTVQTRLGLFQLYQISPPPATSQTPMEKQALTTVTDCAKNAKTDYTNAEPLSDKALEAEDAYKALLAVLPKQYKQAMTAVQTAEQANNSNSWTIADNLERTYNATLADISSGITTLHRFYTQVQPYPTDAQNDVTQADSKVHSLKLSNGPGYQVPTDITNEVNDTNTSSANTAGCLTTINKAITDVNSLPWPTGCPKMKMSV